VPQAQHFEMVFAVARMAGWLPDRVRCEHVTFGNVLGPDRKMFKSRSGDTVKLAGLLDEAIERADAALVARNTDLDERGSRTALAVEIARAAIKYADLSTERQHDYVFDLDRMIAFEGDTGPYLQYAHARLRSIFRRSRVPPWDPPGARFALESPRRTPPRSRTARVPRGLRSVTRVAPAAPSVRLPLRPGAAFHRLLRRLPGALLGGRPARRASRAV
jgi:arginyl-tRNA synthetase